MCVSAHHTPLLQEILHGWALACVWGYPFSMLAERGGGGGEWVRGEVGKIG